MASTSYDMMKSFKLHWAITGKTAAEMIYTEADATKLFMGLKTWKAAPFFSCLIKTIFLYYK
jgi:hypothetical protein